MDLLPGEVHREQGRAAMYGLIGELDLENAFGVKPGTYFCKAGC